MGSICMMGCMLVSWLPSCHAVAVVMPFSTMSQYFLFVGSFYELIPELVVGLS